jgi:hypothetical protein
LDRAFGSPSVLILFLNAAIQKSNIVGDIAAKTKRIQNQKISGQSSGILPLEIQNDLRIKGNRPATKVYPANR